MTSTPLLSLSNFSKSFYGREVLRRVDLDVMAGEVHALLGQNGSGKSTLIKCLSGYHGPDKGAELRIRQTPIPLPLDPTQPRLLGLAFVHQQLGLAQDLTVLENLQVGRFTTGRGWRIRWRANEDQVHAALARVGAESIDPHSLVGTLTEVERAMVAIARGLQELESAGSGVLVLDEPTAYLPRDGVQHLFEAVRGVTASGAGVLFVTHRLEEVMHLADRVTVLRDGARVVTADVKDVTERDLVRHIVGRPLSELYPAPGHARDDVVLTVQEASCENIESFSVRLHRGETVGVTGLVGMGQETLPYLLFGSDPTRRGSLAIGDCEVDLAKLSPHGAIELGMALVPGDRARNGGVATARVSENMTLPTLGEYFRKGRVDTRFERRSVVEKIERFQVRPADPDHAFAELSGGNQQKVVLAKWFATNPKVLLLHEPTQGIDVGARQEVFRHIRAFTDAGGAVLVASTEYEDLAHLCDRVIVFRDGRPVVELHGDALTADALVEHAFLTVDTPISPPQEGALR